MAPYYATNYIPIQLPNKNKNLFIYMLASFYAKLMQAIVIVGRGNFN